VKAKELWGDTILLTAQHKRAHPDLTPARFTYTGQMKCWDDYVKNQTHDRLIS